MDHGVGAAEDLVKGIAALDTNAGLVRGDHVGLAQDCRSVVTLGREHPLRAAPHVHQPALADRPAEE